MIFRYTTINNYKLYVWYLSYLLGMLNDYFYTKSSDMLNKNTLGVKKCEASIVNELATKSSDIN